MTDHITPGPARRGPVKTKLDTLEQPDSLEALLGYNLRLFRLERGLTLGELAKRARLTATAVSEIERGNGTKLRTLYNLCIVLGIEPRDVLPSSLEALRVEGVVSDD